MNSLHPFCLRRTVLIKRKMYTDPIYLIFSHSPIIFALPHRDPLNTTVEVKRYILYFTLQVTWCATILPVEVLPLV